MDHTLELTFPQIKRTQKHNLSPTEVTANKKIKTDEEKANKTCNPLEELDKMIAERKGDLNCEDLGNQEDLANLETPRVFCGLSENLNIPLDVITKCDDLGKDLANNLISKGALDVMKVTQDLIRSSVAKS